MEKLTVSVPEAARLLGISRGTAYALAAEGKLPVLKLGQKRLVVPIRAIERMLDSADGKPA